MRSYPAVLHVPERLAGLQVVFPVLQQVVHRVAALFQNLVVFSELAPSFRWNQGFTVLSLGA